ncbi:terminase [Bifidobacterium goeldii]|uniref:Terminase n=1 Tax=Bifidobacterium goeldii TaxID=2306975 RepID=A0A430FM85_9BIFI|nr:hypothetical protein [Bifidobacterium goeldii]RSX53937.1 terminase [Bifidobacterium goeldii]
MVEHDEMGRVISWQAENEWDATEREWMLALDEYEHSLCPYCGMPSNECHDPLMPTHWQATIDVCQTQLMRNVAISQWKQDHPGEDDRAGALTTRLTPRIEP